MSPLTESTRLTLAKTPGTGLDADAQAYIAAVEAADGQALEAGVKWNIDQFVRGCKADGIWTAIKASCILSGARTLAGALIPLAGTAPTNVGPFVTGDYNRKTGLVGNGSTKYLNSNRNNNVDPQDNNHNSIYITSITSGTQAYIGADPPTNSTGANNIGRTDTLFLRSRNASFVPRTVPSVASLIGTSRATSASFVTRASGVNESHSQSSQTSYNGNVTIFATGANFLSTSRLAFYSIGESLDLALLDTRITTLINSNALVIP
jgi:hypothetical protein